MILVRFNAKVSIDFCLIVFLTKHLHSRQIEINEQANVQMLEAIPDFIRATWVVLASNENKLNSPEISTASHSLYCSHKKEPQAAMQLKNFPVATFIQTPETAKAPTTTLNRIKEHEKQSSQQQTSWWFQAQDEAGKWNVMAMLLQGGAEQQTRGSARTTEWFPI